MVEWLEGPLLWVALAGGALLLVIWGLLLFDLRRSEVRHLPRWAWALIIVLVTFPIGPILYLAIGRVPASERATSGPSRTAEPSALHLRPAARDAVPPEAAPRPSEAAVIATESLHKVYGETTALADVDLVVPRGCTYGLIGPNGAGKTTMLSILAGLRRPTSGTVHLGVERRRIAVLVDTPLFEPWLTGHEVVDLARHLVAPDLPGDRVDAALHEVGLEEAADRRCGGYSRGMLQRLGIATCLVGEPEVLMLDEPSSALDPGGRREVLDLIGRLAGNKTVVLSTHILADVQQVCDMVGVIDRGRLRYQGPISELLARTSSAYSLHVRGVVDGLVAALEEQPWTRGVERLAAGRLRLVTDDAAEAERVVPRLVADQELALISFNPATDLETAFLELTR